MRKLLNNFRSVAEYYPNIRKSVTQILCSLRKFENEHFPPYLYSSLIHSVDMMIDILQEAATNGLKIMLLNIFSVSEGILSLYSEYSQSRPAVYPDSGF